MQRDTVLRRCLIGAFAVTLALTLTTRADRVANAVPAATLNQPAPATSSQVTLVRQAFNAIYGGYFNPIAAGDLLAAAWRGAALAAQQAGGGALAPTPDLSGSASAAYSRFAVAYEELEQSTPIDATTLAYGAIRGMERFVNNCHTYFLTPAQVAAQRARSAGQALIGPGYLRSHGERPWFVTYLAPDGPAERAGLRLGDQILAYDGDSSDQAPILASDKEEGETLTLTVQRPGEGDPPRQLDVVIGRYSLPRIEARVVAGSIGYVRFFTWEAGGAQARAVADALADFDRQGVTGWVLDVRNNSGGAPGPITNLFALEGSPIVEAVSRSGGAELVSTNGGLVSPAKPLVILIGPDSFSASEVAPEALRQLNRAVLIGEHTTGCMAETRAVPLSDGSAIYVTEAHGLVGPQRLDLEGIGVAPDFVAPLSAADLAAGRDPGLETAVSFLQQAAAAAAMR